MFDIALMRAIPITTVAADLGFKLSKSGSGLCRLPGHPERNPSFSVRVKSNSFRCFSCGRGGSVVDLVMLMENLDFMGACRWLDQHYLHRHEIKSKLFRSGRRPPEAKRPVHLATPPPPLFSDPELFGWVIEQSPLLAIGRQYMAGRGISDATLSHFRVGQIENSNALLRAALLRFSEQRLSSCGLMKAGAREPRFAFPSGYLLFPFFDCDAVVYLQARRCDNLRQHRWLCPANLAPSPFNLNALSDSSTTLTICEGVTDVLSAHELGMSAVGLLGAWGKLQPHHMARLRSRNIAVVGDSDPAGQGFAKRLMKELARHGFTVTSKRLPVDCNDINDFLLSRQERTR